MRPTTALGRAPLETRPLARDTASLAAGLFAPGDGPPALLAGVAALARLRVVALAGQAAAIVAALAWNVDIPIVPLALVLAGMLAFSIRTQVRIARGAPATHREILTHALIDVGAFTILIACTGGETNPFILLYLVHVAVMGLLLPPRQAAAGVAIVLASAAAAATLDTPLAHVDGTPLAPMLGILGWSSSFALTAAITSWLVVRVVSALHAYARDLAEARRIVANDEAVIRVGALAAGAAHELGTPLGTMAVVVGEMQRNATSGDCRRDADILAAQIAACRQTLARLLASTGRPGTEGGGPVALDAFVERLFERFRSTRPGVALVVHVVPGAPAPRLFADASLAQALLNLLNNAADAARSSVGVTVDWNGGELRLTVDDDGPGIPADALAKLGRERFTTKPPGQGTGLGLLLTATVIGRLGGTVGWSNRPEGGARADVRLPLAALKLQEPTP